MLRHPNLGGTAYSAGGRVRTSWPFSPGLSDALPLPDHVRAQVLDLVAGEIPLRYLILRLMVRCRVLRARPWRRGW
jgi:hypothetical protein